MFAVRLLPETVNVLTADGAPAVVENEPAGVSAPTVSVATGAAEAGTKAIPFKVFVPVVVYIVKLLPALMLIVAL